MSEYQVRVRICDENGANCQAAQWVPSTEVPTRDGWFGLTPSDAEYWDVVTAFAALMALTWGVKYLVRYASGRK